MSSSFMSSFQRRLLDTFLPGFGAAPSYYDWDDVAGAEELSRMEEQLETLEPWWLNAPLETYPASPSTASPVRVDGEPGAGADPQAVPGAGTHFVQCPWCGGPLE